MRLASQSPITQIIDRKDAVERTENALTSLNLPGDAEPNKVVCCGTMWHPFEAFASGKSKKQRTKGIR